MNVEDFVKGIPNISARVRDVSIHRTREWGTDNWRWEVVIELRDKTMMHTIEPIDVAGDDLPTTLIKAVFDLGGRLMSES